MTILKGWHSLTREDLGMLAVGFVVAFVSALAAVRALVKFV